MIKKLLLAFTLLAFGLVSALAADKAQTGKVISIEGSIVKIEVAGPMPAWAKKGAFLRAVTSTNELLLRGAKITAIDGAVMIITTAKAKEMKVGDVYTIAKGVASAGC